MHSYFIVTFTLQHYAIVDASEGLVFVAVYHDVNTTNLYTSDVTGTRFVLSLKYVAGSPREDWTDGRPLFDVHVVNILLAI